MERRGHGHFRNQVVMWNVKCTKVVNLPLAGDWLHGYNLYHISQFRSVWTEANREMITKFQGEGNTQGSLFQNILTFGDWIEGEERLKTGKRARAVTKVQTECGAISTRLSALEG